MTISISTTYTLILRYLDTDYYFTKDGNVETVKQALNKYTVSEQYMTAINLAIKENKK